MSWNEWCELNINIYYWFKSWLTALSPPAPSVSEEGHFHHAAVAVDSKPCAVVGRSASPPPPPIFPSNNNIFSRRDILRQKGTAVDAAIAVLFCNGVVTSQSMGIGGGFIMTVHLANGTDLSLVARETAPAAATTDMFRSARSSSILCAMYYVPVLCTCTLNSEPCTL